MTMNAVLRKDEIILGILYSVFQFLFLPVIASLVYEITHLPLWVLQFGAFVLNFVCTLVIFRRFLLQSFRDAKKSPGKLFAFSGLGMGIYNTGNVLFSILVLLIYPAYANLNDESIVAMAKESGIWIPLATVLLVPVVEECIFRGLLFRGIHTHHPILAWILSVVLFSAMHISGYILDYSWITSLLAFIQYLPAGIALCVAYRLSGTIVAPILMHSLLNLLAMLVLMTQ